jgi:uncharacterized FlaG/YvyC family protein
MAVPAGGVAMTPPMAKPVLLGAGAVQSLDAGPGKTGPDARDTLRQSEIIEEMRAALSASARTRLQIERDADGDSFIYRLLDPETGETLRRWPPESFGDLVNFLTNESGGLINEQA